MKNLNKLVFLLILTTIFFSSCNNILDEISESINNQETVSKSTPENTSNDNSVSNQNQKKKSDKSTIYYGSYISTERGNIWIKLDVKSDGTYEYYEAMPADDNWGEAKKGTYTKGTSKYIDTGERYYYILCKANSGDLIDGEGMKAIFRDAKTITLHTSWFGTYNLEKSDRFPFSE